MKYYLLIFFLLQITCYGSHAQDILIKGIVADSLTKEPIPYVNIGFPGANFGTVSKENGIFTLQNIPEAFKGKSLVLSHIGYTKKNASWSGMNSLDTIFLQQTEFKLGEVLVQAKKTKTRKLGIRTHSPFLWGTTQNRNGDMVELAQRINSPDQETLLRSANIYLRSVYGDSAIVRINFYKDSGHGPGKRLVHQQILEKRIIHEGWQSFNLTPYNILLEKDFYISFEFLPLTDNPVVVTTGAKVFRGNGYARTSSLGNWKKIGGAYSIYLEVTN